MAIFQHTDCDGDSAELLADSGDPQEDLILMTAHRNGTSKIGVRLDRAAALRLANALDMHLHQDDWNGEPEPVYEALVRRLVAEEVARVLPLHQSPQAAVERLANALIVPPEAVHEYATNTGLALCTDTACTYPFDHRAESHAEHDPEPQAVGHPEAPAVDWSDKLFGRAEYPEGLKFDYCTGCGHSWGAHGDWGTGKHQCDSQLGKDRCGCTLRRGAADECTCTHKMTYAHSSKYGCTLAGCKCTWKRSTS